MTRYFDQLAAIADGDHADDARVAVPVSLVREMVRIERAEAVMRAARVRIEAACAKLEQR